MWIIVKYKKNELASLIKEFHTKVGSDIKIFEPKIKYQKKIRHKLKLMEASLLDNYLFCYHDSFKEKLSAERLKYCRGLIQVLDGWIYNQNSLLQFIKLCKESADKKGFLTQKFFNILDIKRAKFISGPFTDMLFYIISKTKKNLKISIENKIAIIDRNAGYLYHAI